MIPYAFVARVILTKPDEVFPVDWRKINFSVLVQAIRGNFSREVLLPYPSGGSCDIRICVSCGTHSRNTIRASHSIMTRCDFCKRPIPESQQKLALNAFVDKLSIQLTPQEISTLAEEILKQIEEKKDG